ncbi:MAG: hypothetical protein HZA91_04335 [Verrucomicrobia bacterium]|nr:hypothetical protein [Verrucomicrobiota bacterium]
MRPIKKAPSLFTLNGFGFAMYGKRDFDAETGTYIKTRYLCALFIPIVSLGAYRVADAREGGWYFLGKESLSPFARAWNFGAAWMAAVLAVSLGWSAYVSSPEYQVKQHLQTAANYAKEGKPLQAAELYRELADGSYYVGESREGLRSSLERCLQNDSAATVAGALRLLAGLPARLNQPAPPVPDAFKRGLSLVEKFRPSNSDGALEIVRALALLDPKNETTKPLLVALLKQIIAARPDDTGRAVELALVYESNRRMAESVSALLPHRAKLGLTEGARILGQQFLREGKHEDAYGLLYPYVQPRLEKLRAVESVYTNALAAAYGHAFEDLKAGRADGAFYQQYEKASAATQSEMVEAFAQKRMEHDPALNRAVGELKLANEVVPVTLDLGLVQLSRAQDLKDPAARKAELQAAEKTFLAIRSFAGESDEYRLFLGQVYYWLGKSVEGKHLFDQLLAKNKRAYAVLISLARTLRDVGEYGQARSLMEEAYRTTQSEQEKFAIAALRASTFVDSDDQIAWLGKSNPKDVVIQIELNGARGSKALEQGDKPAAARLLGAAVASYEKMPKTAVLLNNWGLACFSLYQASGDIEHHKRGLALLEESIAMAPGNSVQLCNVVYSLLTQAVLDVVGDQIHTEMLKEPANISMLSYLYDDEAQRNRVYQRLRESESMKKCVAYLDKALLLAPKNLGLYETAAEIHGDFRDLPELQKLQQRFRLASPDFSESRKQILEYYNGAKDAEYLKNYGMKTAKLEALLQQPAVKEHPLTLEYVNVSLVALRQSISIYGGQTDSVKLLEMALAASQKHPSSLSQRALISAYLFRADDEMGRQSREYAALAKRTRRAISPSYLVAFVLDRGGSLGDLARTNAHVLKAVAMEKDHRRLFPSRPSPYGWAMLRTVESQTAAELVAKLKEGETFRLVYELEHQLSPFGASSVLNQYWVLKMLGDETRAAQIYEEAVRSGVPLPQLQ